MIFGFNTDVKYGDSVYHVQSEARVHDRLLQTQVFVKGRCIGKRATSYAEQFDLPGFSEQYMQMLLKEQHRFIVNAARTGNIENELSHPTPIKFSEIGAPMDAIQTDLQPTVTSPQSADLPGADVSRPPSAGSASPPPASLAAAVPIPDSDSDSGILDIPVQPPVIKIGAVDAAADVLDPAGLSDLMAAIESNAPLALVAPMGKPVGSGLEIECTNPDTAYDGTSVVMKLMVTQSSGSPAGDAQLACRVSVGRTPPSHFYAATQGDGSGEIRFDVPADDVFHTTVLIQASLHTKTLSRRFHLVKPAK